MLPQISWNIVWTMTSYSVTLSLWIFAQGPAVILSCSVQKMLRSDEILIDLSLRFIADAYIVLHNPKAFNIATFSPVRPLLLICQACLLGHLSMTELEIEWQDCVHYMSTIHFSSVRLFPIQFMSWYSSGFVTLVACFSTKQFWEIFENRDVPQHKIC